MVLNSKDSSDKTTSINLEKTPERREKEANIGSGGSSNSSGKKQSNYAGEIAKTLKRDS